MRDLLTSLSHLADLHAQQEALTAHEATALPQYLKDRLAKINARYAPQHATLTAQIAHTTQQVKADVLAHGASVKGAQLQAVYSPGRLLWDSAALGGYAIEHPEVLLLASMGAPSVSIRQVKETI